jgi:hypothetical protein
VEKKTSWKLFTRKLKDMVLPKWLNKRELKNLRSSRGSYLLVLWLMKKKMKLNLMKKTR